MEALEAVRSAILARRSCRQGYSSEPISRDVLIDLVTAGVYAPSGANTQPVRFLIETRPEQIAALAPCRRGSERIIGQAAALIIVFVDRASCPYLRAPAGKVWATLPYQDSAAAIQNMLLLATAHGLASCWVSAFTCMDHHRILSGRTWGDILKGYRLPPTMDIMGIVALAHTDRTPQGDEIHHGRPVARQPVECYLLPESDSRP